MKKADAGLDSSIKKLLSSMYGEEIDEKIDAKFAELRSEIEPKLKQGKDNELVPLIAGLRETKERLARLETGMGKFISLYKKPEQTEKLLSIAQSETEKLASDLKEEIGKCRDKIEDMQAQIAGIHEAFSEMREIREALKGVDIKGVTREIESLKQKAAWLEQNQQPQDIEALKERLDEIEAQLKAMKLGSAMVIE